MPVESLVFRGLSEVAKRHAVLGISIVNDNTTYPSFVRLPKVDLRTVVRFVHQRNCEPSFESIVETEHRMPFSNLGESPLWRVVVIVDESINVDAANKYITISFLFHHGVCDGKSGLAFHLELLDAFNTLQFKDDSFDPIIDIPQLDMLPSLEEANKLAMSPFFIIREVFKAYWPRTDKSCWTGPPIRSKPNVSMLRTAYLPNSVVESMTSLCRKNAVSLTALLIVLIARVLALNIPDYERFSSSTAMSFRRFTDIGPRAMVNYVSSIAHRFSTVPRPGYILCGGELNWEAVRACDRGIRKRTASPKNQQVGLLRFLHDYAAWFRKKDGKPRESSFSVSNLGVMDGSGDRDYKVRVGRLLFSQSGNVINAPFVFNFITAKGGDLGIALTWQEGIIEQTLAENVLREFVSQIRRLVNQ